ncbi:hypothetical protein HY468_04935 [Candidatus Roizmanbacteria bacterium]|nr:hypothetical protein [Candidatus Roizmanbacteria bacterium]
MVRKRRFPKKSLLFSIGMTISAWIAGIYIFLFMPPASATYGILSVCLFIGIGIPAGLLTKHARHGVVIAAAVVFYLLLRLFELDSSLNLVLLGALLLTVEWYFRKS